MVRCREIRGFLRGCQLPNTIIFLLLFLEKVEAVKKKLSNIDPKFLLFVSKINKLVVCEL